MRVGVVLPSFSSRAVVPLEAARAAEDAGLHGAFVYDHLWPLGHRDQPALASFPLLGALAASTTSVLLGTVVARVAMVSDEMLVRQFLSVHALSDGRCIAGIGTGDSKSKAENLAYGLGFSPAGQRRAALERVGAALVEAGIETWVGGSSPLTRAVARSLGDGAAVNLWEADAQAVASLVREGPVTWAGSFPGSEMAAAEQLDRLAAAGASWAIYAWPGSAQLVSSAAHQVGIELAR